MSDAVGIGTRRASRLVALHGTAEIPEFQVCVLGPKGCGKTVFLAALFGALATQDKRRNAFFLDCPDLGLRDELHEKLDQLKDTCGEWPPPTYHESCFSFDCVHDLRGNAIKLFRFRYVDFPGGYLTRQPAGFSIDEYARNSHSIIVLLDGQKILDLLEGRPITISIYDDIRKMAPVLQRCIGCPIHFIITKWDVLETAAHDLEKIRDKLLAFRDFRNLVEQLVDRGPVRLVPVSAVGRNFAKYEDGMMKKLTDGIIEPLYVDLSIGMTLIDQIGMLQAAGAEKSHPLIARLWVVKKIMLLIAKCLDLKDVMDRLNNDEVLSTFTQTLPINVAAVLTQYGKFLKAANARLDTVATGLEEEIRQISESIRDRNSAVDAIVQIQTALIAAFEKKFPASNLSAGAIVTTAPAAISVETVAAPSPALPEPAPSPAPFFGTASGQGSLPEDAPPSLRFPN
jgi:hypothetical protein